mgnify:CR=1 FL=1
MSDGWISKHERGEKRVKVRIVLEGTQTMDGESETTALDVQGVLEGTADGFLLRYREESGDETMLRAEAGWVSVERKGAFGSRLLLEEGRRHDGEIDTGCGVLAVGVSARAVRTACDAEGATLELCYTLELGPGVTTEHVLRAEARPC